MAQPRRLQIRLTEQDLAVIDHRAAMAGLSRSEYARRVLTGRVVGKIQPTTIRPSTTTIGLRPSRRQPGSGMAVVIRPNEPR